MVLHKEHDVSIEHQLVQGLCHLDKYEGHCSWLSVIYTWPVLLLSFVTAVTPLLYLLLILNL